MQAWIVDNKPGSLSELVAAFPQELRSGGIFTPLAEAEAKYKRQGSPRYFLADDEIVKLPDSTHYAISNQWSKEWADNFISRAKKLGFKIEEVA